MCIYIYIYDGFMMRCKKRVSECALHVVDQLTGQPSFISKLETSNLYWIFPNVPKIFQGFPRIFPCFPQFSQDFPKCSKDFPMFSQDFPIETTMFLEDFPTILRRRRHIGSPPGRDARATWTSEQFLGNWETFHIFSTWHHYIYIHT